MSAPSAKQRTHARDAFEEGAIALFRKAVSQRLGFRMSVDARGGDGLAELLDDEGVTLSSCRLAGVQLALPLGAPTTAPSSPPVLPTASVVTVRAGVLGRDSDGVLRIEPATVTVHELPAIPPIAPAGRVLRSGDAVHAPDGSTWVVRAIEGGAVYLSLDDWTDGLPDEATVARDAITLDAADLWRVAAVPVIPEAPATGVSQVSDGHLAGVSETPDGDPRQSPWTLFSVEVPDTHENAQAWALVKGLAWCCGGYILWHIEGGASRRGRHRMVAIVPREHSIELLDLCNDARLTPDTRGIEYGDSLLRVGSRVRRESGAPWLVASIDRSMLRATLECGGATIAPDVAEIETTTDGSGDFVLVPLAPTPSKTPARVVPKVGCAVSFEGRDCTLSRLDDDGFTLRLPDGTARRLERELLTWDGPAQRFVAVDAYKGAAKVSATKSSKSSKGSAPKGNSPKIPEGCVELRVSARDFPKHRKGLLALSMKPLDGVWKRVGDVMAAVVNVEGMSARRVLSYCNGADVKLAIEGRPSDVAKINGGAAAEAAPEPPVTTDDGFELFAERRAARWWIGHAKKGRFGLLRHWIDGRVELLATGATEAEVRKHERGDLMAPGVTEVVVVGRDGYPIGSSSRGHDAYAVPGRWTVVASSERGYLRWVGDDETEARAALERACAAPDGIVVVLVGLDGKEKVERRGGAQSRREVAEDAARDERLPRATRSMLGVGQSVRVAPGSAGINGVPVSLAGLTVTVLKIGPKLVKVHSEKLKRSYSVLPGDLELLVDEGGRS